MEGGEKTQEPPPEYPAPGQQYPAPGQQYPAPGQQQYPATSQQYPAPGQQYPPPAGNDPPPVYHPQQQPVQGGYAHPPPGHPAQPYGQPIAMQPLPMQQHHPQQQPGAVVIQPGGINNPMGQNAEVWMMPPPVAPPNCPPGLEYMTQIDQLLVKQQLELLEIVSGFETNNKYKIKNSLGQNVYYAIEDTDCCTRQCCGPMREFNMKVYDNANNEVIHLYRPYRCQFCCCPCFLQEIEVASPPGTVIGYVIQKWTICTPSCAPRFEICNAQREAILLIEGPACVIACCADIEFKVLSLDGTTQVGKVTKQWSGFMKEAFTDADTFGITFPMDLDVKAKATMLGAVMLIDFMYFEQSNNNNQHH